MYYVIIERNDTEPSVTQLTREELAERFADGYYDGMKALERLPQGRFPAYSFFIIKGEVVIPEMKIIPTYKF